MFQPFKIRIRFSNNLIIKAKLYAAEHSYLEIANCNWELNQMGMMDAEAIRNITQVILPWWRWKSTRVRYSDRMNRHQKVFWLRIKIAKHCFGVDTYMVIGSCELSGKSCCFFMPKWIVEILCTHSIEMLSSAISCTSILWSLIAILGNV